MYWKRVPWLLKCLLYSLLGIFVAGRVSDLLNPLIWWALHQSGATSLQRPFFIAAYYLPLIGIYGFSLGLIPIHHLQELLASSAGKFRFRSHLRPEMIFCRPLLWAWVPVGLVLAVRIWTFSLGRDHSVLASTAYGESRFEHFFAPYDGYPKFNPSVWIFDRFVLTGPTLFLTAYTVGVWLRHQYPNSSLGDRPNEML